MKTYNLPDDLNSGIAFKNDEVIIRQYQSGHNSTTKNKIILSQNMISLVLSGSKTVIYPESIATVNEGEMVILSTGNILTSEVTTGNTDFSSVILYFSNNLLKRFYIK